MFSSFPKQFRLQTVKDKGAAYSVIQVLKDSALIRWSSCSQAKSQLGCDDSVPPMLMWQLSPGNECKEIQIQNLIEDFDTQVGWELRKLKTGKWRLMTSKAQAYFEGNTNLIPSEASGLVSQNSPDYAKLANKEILELANWLRIHLAESN